MDGAAAMEIDVGELPADPNIGKSVRGLRQLWIDKDRGIYTPMPSACSWGGGAKAYVPGVV